MCAPFHWHIQSSYKQNLYHYVSLPNQENKRLACVIAQEDRRKFPQPKIYLNPVFSTDSCVAVHSWAICHILNITPEAISEYT